MKSKRKEDESIAFINSDHPCCLPTGDVCQITAELTALREEVERLLFALQRYGEHRTICQLLVGGPCSCGLAAALSPLSAQQEAVPKQD